MSRATCRGRSTYSANGGRANVVIGNPPWLAFRYMSADLQKRFKELAKGLGVYVGGKLRDAKRSLRAVHRPVRDALFTRLWPSRLRAAAGGADARPIRTPPLGRFPWRRHPVGRSLDDGRQRAAAVSRPLLRRIRPPPRDLEAHARNRARLFGRPAASRRAGSSGRPPDRRGRIQGHGERAEADRGEIHRRLGLP